MSYGFPSEMARMGKIVTSNERSEASAPWNFSWIVANELAGMGWPKTRGNLEYLVNEGIKHLVTLSPEKVPPISGFKTIKWTKIDIEEFEAPTMDQIQEFIDICRKCRDKNEPVGVHCRMGNGRTGVMAACYLVHFQDMAPERALIKIRLQRPGSVETREQERAVLQYRDYLRKSGPEDHIEGRAGKI